MATSNIRPAARPAMKVAAKPVHVTKANTPNEPYDKLAEGHPFVQLGEIEKFDAIPGFTRGSKYEFGLNELQIGQGRFVTLGAEVSKKTLDQALRNSIKKERMTSPEKNFIMRPETKDGVEGFRLYCVSVEEYAPRTRKAA